MTSTRVRGPVLVSALLLGGSVLLSGCGSVVGAFIPPQTITNPAGLTGKTLATSSTLVMESVKGTVHYSTQDAPKSSFDDIKYPDNIPFGIRPHGLAINSGLASATVTGACVKPASFTLTLKKVTVTLKDATSTATVTATPSYTVTLTKTGSSLTDATYSVSGGTLNVTADRTATDAAIVVLTSGGVNDAQLDADLSASDNGLAGCTMTMKLGETTAVLSDFS